jgi:hypothetical protein
MHEVNMEEKKIDNRFYSAHCARLAELQGQNAAMRLRRLRLDADDVVPFMRDYGYPLSAWPIIIGSERIAEFAQFVTRLPRLYLKAVKCLFEGSGEQFAAYLNESPLIHEMLMAPDFDIAQMVNRHDVVFSGGQLKLLEVNAGCAIGGWQPGLLEPQFRQILDEFRETATWRLRHRQVIDQLFAGVLAAIGERKPALRGKHVLMYCPDQDALAGAAIRERFAHTVLALGAQGRHDQLFLFSDFASLTFRKDGALCFEGQEMDAILLADAVHGGVSKALYLRLIGAQMMGRIVMPDSTLYTVFGNKLLMATLHEPALQAHLTEAERAFIAAHIPYTVRMASQSVTWEGRAWELGALLRARKDAFVVKQAHSFQGRGVHIGKFSSDAEWEEVLARVRGNADWLAQAYCAVDCASAPDMAGNLSRYALVWGIFDTGNAYGGAFIRGMATDDGRGVINSAQGALEFCVFEEAACATSAP